MNTEQNQTNGDDFEIPKWLLKNPDGSPKHLDAVRPNGETNEQHLARIKIEEAKPKPSAPAPDAKASTAETTKPVEPQASPPTAPDKAPVTGKGKRAKATPKPNGAAAVSTKKAPKAAPKAQATKPKAATGAAQNAPAPAKPTAPKKAAAPAPSPAAKTTQTTQTTQPSQASTQVSKVSTQASTKTPPAKTAPAPTTSKTPPATAPSTPAPAEGKNKASKTKRVERDQFGFSITSKVHEAAMMYLNGGATTPEVKAKLGSPHLNLLTEVQEKGFLVETTMIEINGKKLKKYHIKGEKKPAKK